MGSQLTQKRSPAGGNPARGTGSAKRVRADTDASVFLDVVRQAGCTDYAATELLRLQRLILAQFRWLDSLASGGTLTGRLLELLDACTSDLQRDVIKFLPEIVTEEHHAEVLDKLRKTCETDVALLLPALEALSMLCLDDELQDAAVGMAIDRLDSVSVADLPAVLHFVLVHADCKLRQVVPLVREKLLFLAPADPRLPGAQADVQGAPADAPADDELHTFLALRNSLRLSPAACSSFMAELKSLTGDDERRVTDVWVPLILHSFGGSHGKAAGTLFKKQVTDGSRALLSRAIVGHQAVLHELGGMDASSQKEVLRALHAHLGSQAAPQVSAALAALLRLSVSRPLALLRHATFLMAILDHMDAYSPEQLHMVFELFSELVVCASAEGGDTTRSQLRIGQELQAFLQKQMSSSDARAQRVGVIGTARLVRRLWRGPPACAAQAKEHVRRVFEGAAASPGGFAVFCDDLADFLDEDQSVPSEVVAWLSEAANDCLDGFMADVDHGVCADNAAEIMVPGGFHIQGELWLSLHQEAPVAYSILPRLAMTHAADRDALLYVGALLRLMREALLRRSGTLGELEATLVCPLLLPPADMTTRCGLTALPPTRRELVALALWHAVTWLREALNTFSGDPPTATLGAVEVRQLVVLRLQQLCQFEALLEVALEHAPPSFAKAKTVKAKHQPWEKGSRVGEVRRGMRPLQAPAFLLVACLNEVEQPAARAAPAAYLLAELQGQMDTLDTSSTRPMPPGTMKPQCEAELLRTLPAILPALRLHLDSALQLQQALDADGGEEEDSVAPAHLRDAALPEGPLLIAHETEALAPRAALGRLISSALGCVRRLAGSRAVKTDAALRNALLAAFAPEGAGVAAAAQPEVEGVEQALAACSGACTYFEGLACQRGYSAGFDCVYVAVTAMHALVVLAEATAAHAANADACEAVLQVIKEDWDPAPRKGAPKGALKAAAPRHGWHGRAPAMAALVRFYLGYHCEPVAELLRLASAIAHADATNACAAFSEATVATWYRALVDQLITQWEALRAAMARAASAGAEQDRGKLTRDAARCSEAFSRLARFTRQHEHNQLVLGQAVRLGIRFAEALLRMESFWKERLAACPSAATAFKAVCEHTSKGTRACQAVCQVAKARKDLAITGKVPRAKRAFEALLSMAGNVCGDAALWIGVLKNKDLAGQEMLSQAQEPVPCDNEDVQGL
ncbi:hypothetical protein WJX81_001207 [Elliptochloris bilobata]|uniref:Fanconi anemia group D2 protein n=1 Tax=Elliptochloris bilobata TaxID=381761 RepID=A0AAW1RHE9_9CHLO